MSRADRFDRGDFDVRYTQPKPVLAVVPTAEPEPVVRAPVQAPTAPAPGAVVPARSQAVQWPIARPLLKRIGDSVLADRNGHGRPHKGIDLFADAGTEVRAASAGEVLRVVDGRHSGRDAQRRAGLFVDVRASNALVFRYLHLGEARVKSGAQVQPGTVLGLVAPPRTSGLASAPHVHFEVRQGDYDPKRRDYGIPVDPLRLLPPLRA